MAHYHFIGVGGIGMSGSAAMTLAAGNQVSGSDRGADRPENRRILDALKKQGVAVFPQDGSFITAGKPDFLVYSTAIEEDNPDFAAAPETPRLHRSELLEKLVEGGHYQTTIAVSGSCGKSTVTAYLAEALLNLGGDPGCLDGALVKRFITDCFAGNFRPGDGSTLVFEADESDKSLLRYAPDYALVLNIGTDHYDKAELARVFGEFLKKVRRGAVLERDVYEAVKPVLPPGLDVRVFDPQPRRDAHYALLDYQVIDHTDAIYQDGKRTELAPSGDRPLSDGLGMNNMLRLYGFSQEDCRIKSRLPIAKFSGDKAVPLPQFGRHVALNALAIYAMLEMLGFEPQAALAALGRFDGVWRRNDFAGNTPGGALVFDDYAHNPEKIVSALCGMREYSPEGHLYAVFQPHGFGPWGFMRDELFLRLENELKPGDKFIILPPFYAGGTSSFKPTAEEVASDWKSRARHPEHYMVFDDRGKLRDYLELIARSGDLIVILGARDNSLSDYAASLTR
ncbi:MAG: Mur ligase domain-containing protein [Victivallaceae bacterium]|nr:Mur ligase domain-containing protein [Victivallaceae bacterium]